MKEHSINSSYRERLIEHLFVGELLKLSWHNKDFSLEVSKPEVDDSGYDMIIEASGVLRHVQLKAAFIGAKTARQNVHVSLATKPSGCVVWVYFNQDTLELGPYLFFGGQPGEPLPDISSHKVAKHTKGDAEGFKAERPNIRVINKGAFKKYLTTSSLYQALFCSVGRKSMTLQELGEKLHEMYFESEVGEAVAMIHLFGVKYAAEITESGASKKEIAKAAGIRESYGTEISKGVKLSRYVRAK